MRPIVAIPVFNERKHVQSVLQKIRGYHDQILAIDDGSSDGTAELLEARDDIQLIRHSENRGYGQSIIDAFTYADAHGYDWVITIDCDEQHEPAMIPDFIREARKGDADIISGSRYLNPSDNDDLPPGDRRTINATITALVNTTYGLNLTDAFCGFKAHRVSAMLPLKLDETGYAFPLQLWPRAVAAGVRIRELPVRLIYNDPNRHFGGQLDNAAVRLQHYLEVFNRERNWTPSPSGEPLARESAGETRSCCCRD